MLCRGNRWDADQGSAGTSRTLILVFFVVIFFFSCRLSRGGIHPTQQTLHSSQPLLLLVVCSLSRVKQTTPCLVTTHSS